VVNHDDAMDRARDRARELREYYGHLVTYVLVCSLLVVIDLADGSAGSTFLGLNWAYWPIFGWGIAIVIHTFAVFSPMRGWEDRKTQQLYEEERNRELEHQ
jgi:two-component system LytT family sensor kinase